MTRLFGLSPQLSELSGKYIPNTVLKRLGWYGGDKITSISSGDDLCDDTTINTKYTDATIDILCRSCPNLRHLRIDENIESISVDDTSGRHLTNASIQSIITYCTTLESLSISWEGINNEGMGILATISTLKEFYLNIFEHITSGGIRKVLKANKNLEKLSISTYSAINDNLLRCISLSLPNLRELTLKVGEGCEDISDSSSFIAITQHCPLLENIEIDDWPLGDSFILSLSQYCLRLRHLLVDWDSGEDDDEALPITEAALTRLFQACPDLRTLRNIPATATDASLRALATYCVRLEAVGILWNKHVTNAGLCDLFKACKSLTDVHIRSCYNITDESVFTLVRHCPLVRIMTLDSPKLTEASLLCISTHVLQLQKLTVGHMSVPDDILSIIARRCKYLTDIDILHCTSVISAGVLSLINKCHRLKRVSVLCCYMQISPELKKYIDNRVMSKTELYVDVH